jgi:two-component system CheB/CheR fusion protein
MLTRVFEPFVQAENSLERSQGGLGIGLTLVRKLVELHGGSVMAISAGREQGATFTVRLPLAKELASVPEELPPDFDAPPLRILLVEDLPAVADMTEKLLTCCGHQVVHVAHDGPRALKAAASNTVDVILLDVGLPGMNGYDVARRLREQPLHENVLLVAMTGYGQQEDRRRGQEAGFDHHLVKPVSLEALQRVLCDHSRSLQRRSLQSQAVRS